MNVEFSNIVNSFGDEIFSALTIKMNERIAMGLPVYKFFVGTPDFETPQYIMDALCEAGKDPKNWKYTLGDCEELKQAVKDYYKRRFDVDIEKDEVASCNGSQEGLSHMGMLLANKGDLVLLPTPCYPAFITCAKMAELDVFYYPMLRENNFLPDVSLIPDEVADKAKFMIVSLPSNPMGSVGNEENYKEIIAFAKKHNILIIHDNAYSDIVFDGVKCGSFLKVEGAKEVGVEFFSLSKTFNITGARISFLVGRSDVIKNFYKLRSQYDFGMFMPLQKVAIACLNHDFEITHKQCDRYEERRNVLCNGLREIGWDVDDSHGSMFVFAKIPSKYNNSIEFAMDLMDKTGVIVTPGSSFGPAGEGYVRFALTMENDKVKEALKAIKDSHILD